jgi:hypothetical protein
MAYCGVPTLQWFLDRIQTDILTPCYMTKRHVRAEHEAAEGNGGTAPLILNLDTRWGRVVSLTPRPLYPGERTPVTIE